MILEYAATYGWKHGCETDGQMLWRNRVIPKKSVDTFEQTKISTENCHAIVKIRF